MVLLTQLRKVGISSTLYIEYNINVNNRCYNVPDINLLLAYSINYIFKMLYYMIWENVFLFFLLNVDSMVCFRLVKDKNVVFKLDMRSIIVC